MKQLEDFFVGSLSENINIVKELFDKDSVIRFRKFAFCGGIDACLVYFDGMVNVELINDSVMRPLVLAEKVPSSENTAEYVYKNLLYSGEVKLVGEVKAAISSILYGDTLLLIDGCKTALVINTKGWRTRGISEPENERVLEGPREGFDEAAMFCVAMLRRRLKTPDFCAEMTSLGRRTNTLVFICYLKSLINREVLRELKDRLKKIDIDSVLDSNYITELISERPSSIFKTVGTTERPDIVCAQLLEGRVALIVDGTPMVITMPYLFSENFQSDEDYYINHSLATAGRLLRMLCFFLSFSAPAVFIALTTFHFELLPSAFALTVANAREGVPFSTLTEAIALTLVFEILRETGIRMPQSVGHALSIVGGLVVGQAAVEARIISAPMLIIVALSGICGLTVPRLRTAVFFMRLIMILAAGLFGLYGYIFMLLIFCVYVIGMTSFGVDATTSLLNPEKGRFKDVFRRAGWRNMKKRPAIQNNDRVRKNG